MPSIAKLPPARGLAAALLALLALLLALGVASQRSVAELAASGQEMQRSEATLAALAALQATVAAAESRQRSAVEGQGQREAADGGRRDAADGASSDPADGAKLDGASARAAAEAHLARLRLLLSTDAEQFSRLVTLGTALTARFDALAATGAEPRRRPPAWPQPQTSAAAESRRPPAAVPAVMQALQSPAQAAAAAAQQRSAAAAGRAALWFWLAGAAALLLAAGLAWTAWRLWAALQQAQVLAAAATAQQLARTADLQHVLTAAPGPICVLDADARVVRANPACLQLWSASADTVAGTAFVDTVLPDDRRRTQLALDQLLAGGALPDFRHRVQRADGSLARVCWQPQWSPADATLVCAGIDITELEALRAQTAQQVLTLRERDAALAAATAQAQKADHVQTLFLSTLGRGLRDPLDAVNTMAELLLQGLSGPLAADQQRQLQQLQGDAQQVRAVVHDMLDIARIEAGALVLRHEPFDLWEAIQQVATALRPRAQDKGLALQLVLADDLGYARGDERRLQQVLAKLLDNAIRFTAAGSITLAAAPRADGLLAISVADTGAGIAAADIGQLFEPFRQPEPEPDGGRTPRHAGAGVPQKRGGVGLGLAIAKRLARLMGGDIAVSSQPGHGSTFTLTLPSDLATLAAAR